MKQNTLVFSSSSAQETFQIGEKIGRRCQPGDVLLLNGELGAGKTVFSQGIGKGLGITEPISSPTFTLLQIYEEGVTPLYHFDVYRISDVEEMEEIGYEDYFYGDGVCLVEWASLIEEILPEKCIRISIEKDLEKGFDFRNITVDAPDARFGGLSQ